MRICYFSVFWWNNLTQARKPISKKSILFDGFFQYYSLAKSKKMHPTGPPKNLIVERLPSRISKRLFLLQMRLHRDRICILRQRKVFNAPLPSPRPSPQRPKGLALHPRRELQKRKKTFPWALASVGAETGGPSFRGAVSEEEGRSFSVALVSWAARFVCAGGGGGKSLFVCLPWHCSPLLAGTCPSVRPPRACTVLLCALVCWVQFGIYPLVKSFP